MEPSYLRQEMDKVSLEQQRLTSLMVSVHLAPTVLIKAQLYNLMFSAIALAQEESLSQYQKTRFYLSMWKYWLRAERLWNSKKRNCFPWHQQWNVERTQYSLMGFFNRNENCSTNELLLNWRFLIISLIHFIYSVIEELKSFPIVRNF